MAVRQLGPADRRCPECARSLARLNPGPLCFACTPDGFSSRSPRQRRKRLPLEQILDAYRRIGDPTEVARELDLPRSSVWYAIKRAKEQGLVPNGATGTDVAVPDATVHGPTSRPSTAERE